MRKYMRRSLTEQTARFLRHGWHIVDAHDGITFACASGQAYLVRVRQCMGATTLELR
jgi:hypothetical protein